MKRNQVQETTETDASALLREELKRSLPEVFFDFEFEKKLDELHGVSARSGSSRKRLDASVNKVGIKWNKRAGGTLLTFEPALSDGLSVIAAWVRQPGVYLSHFSALYFNGLIEQRPKDHFLTKEVAGKSGVTDVKLDPFRVRQAFLKPARFSQNFFSFGDSKTYVLEKVPLAEAGVVRRGGEGESVSLSLRFTSLERTFLDCLIAPQYAGGVQTVVTAFVRADLDADELFRIYSVMNPAYPYWQTVGLVLERFGRSAAADEWERRFSERDKIPFYVEHGAKPYWKFSDRWQVHYPNGAFIGLGN